MMFLDCPAYLDDEGAKKCGLPAEVRSRFVMCSTDGPLESAMIRCPSGHWFNAPIEFLSLQAMQEHDQGSAATAPDTGQRPVPDSGSCRDSRPWRSPWHRA